jgi:hypothetical protein
VAPYVVVGPRIEARVPGSCPWRGRGEACAVGIHCLRARKAGPPFPLVVARCDTHGRSFTLYPIGWAPFGRVAIACVGPAGEMMIGDAEKASDALMRAAFDGASGDLWPIGLRETDVVPCRRTQGRRVAMLAKILGLSPALETRQRERIAGALGIPLLQLRDASAHYADGRSWAIRSKAVVEVYRALGPQRSLVERLLRSGCEAGLWGRPSRWDPGGAALRQLF